MSLAGEHKGRERRWKLKKKMTKRGREKERAAWNKGKRRNNKKSGGSEESRGTEKERR